MLFTLNPKFSGKLSLNRITAEVTVRRGVSYSIYKTSSNNYSTSPDAMKINFVVKSEGENKPVNGLGVIFDSQVEEMIESVKVSYLYTVKSLLT